MKIVVRNKTTCEYVKETGAYTPDPQEAVDFLSFELAAEYCDKYKLHKDHEVLRIIDEMAWDES
jgi:hypothetical protein